MKSSKGRKQTSAIPKSSSCLYIHELLLPVHLGYSSEERSVLQEVCLSIELKFPKAPLGEKTDNLKDTICYGEICKTLRDYVKNREFNLIEKLARDCLSVLCKKYPSVFFRLTLYKKAPPVEGLKGGVKYSCGGKGV